MEQQQWQPPQDKQPMPPQQQHHQRSPRLQCPRCDSSDTKFCYYNNYSLAQPRHYCRTCKRFWTQGGTLRNIPEGGRRKKAKTNSSLGASSSSGKAATMHAAFLDNQVPVYTGGVGINSYHAYYYGSAGNTSAFGGQVGDLHPRAITGNLSGNPQTMAPDMCIIRPLLELHLQQLVQQPQHASLQPNLIDNVGRGHGEPHPAGWPLQPMGAQQLPVTPAFATAPAMAIPPASAPAPASASATADTEVPNWDCILDPSVSFPPPPSPPPSSSTFM